MLPTEQMIKQQQRAGDPMRQPFGVQQNDFDEYYGEEYGDEMDDGEYGDE